MTILTIVAVKDRAVDAYNRPFYVPTIGAAIRSFTDEVNRTESEMNAHPEDYDLYDMGTFCDQTGTFLPADGGVPRVISRAQDLIIK
ncbi:nonstructural protein [Microviridae sp.]|nr:nonstructural protein [Microviridae sp.]